MAQSVGLTHKQFTYYAFWFAGETHQNIADRHDTYRERVTEVIGRALQRRPDLPRRRRIQKRGHQVFQFSQLDFNVEQIIDPRSN